MTDKPAAMPEPTQEQLDAFIARAGFRYGWGNLESWARTMAEQAVSELAALQSAQPAEVSDEAIYALWVEHCEKPGLTTRQLVCGFARAILALRPAQQPESEPFGYFRALPFGWEQCSETDEGAVALYERPQSAQQAVPMTDEQRQQAFNKSWATSSDFFAGIEAAEAHHGITAQGAQEGV